MVKHKWIEANMKLGGSKDVLDFIADICYSQREGAETIYILFDCGYCYYFAIMLKDAFNRGEVCWHRNHSHIVWVDTNGIAYDIGGVFYDYKEGDLLPAEDSLGDMLIEFKHTGKYHFGDNNFHEWAEQFGMTDYYAISDIYRNMPRIDIDDNLSVEENAYLYWMRNEPSLSAKYRLMYNKSMYYK